MSGAPLLTSITHDVDRRGGRACVRELRISVIVALGWLSQGQIADEIVADCPELTAADISACLAYAANRH